MVIARVVLDPPVLFFQAVVFTIILYIMANLDLDSGKFSINLLFVYNSTICIVALYSMLAALSPTIDGAVRLSGITLNPLILYMGYTIPKTALTGDVICFGWLYYLNPVSYSYEAVLTNEFHGRQMECSPTNLVPGVPGAVAGHQGCSLVGATVGNTRVNGNAYFQHRSGTTGHIFGVILVW